MADPGFQRTHDRHGPDAEEDTGGDKALRETLHASAAGFPAQKLRLDRVTGMLDPVVDAQQLAEDGADDHAYDYAEQVLRFDCTRDADQNGAETEGFHHGLAQALFQPVAKENSDQAPRQDRKSVDQYRRHRFITPVCM